MNAYRDGLGERVAELSPEKREILERLLKGQGVDVDLAVIRRRRTSGPRPLSFAQQRLWFLDQLDPGSTAYNVATSWQLEGKLEVGALERSLQEIVRRHEALRTTFVAERGEPAQVIAPAAGLSLPLADLSHLPEGDREQEARRLAMEEARSPFELERGPLLRTKLLRLGEQEHALLLTMHHIVCDGWSMGVLVRELAALYEAFRDGKPSPLPELPVQYADFAAWQKEWLQGTVLEEQVSYWRRQLEGLAALELPTDRPRPPVQGFAGAWRFRVLPAGLIDRVKALSQQEGVTPFMTLLAAFSAVLRCHTGQDDIPVGSPIANRSRPEVEGLIGFFANTLVLRTDLSGDPTFRELVGRVRDVALGAYAHQDLPFERLVEELQPERDLARSPLFQVLFAVQNTSLAEVRLPGLTVTRGRMDDLVSKFDLALYMSDLEPGLIAFEYSTNLFEAATIDRMAGHLLTLLGGAVQDPGRRVSELPLLTPAERQQMLVDWNATRRDYPREIPVHELFEAQVERMPEAVAVLFGEEQLSYRELNCRANQLAHRLRGLGVGPESLVGLFLERSLDLVVAILGVLKAGGAYVPLDPVYPADRLAFMIEDARVPVIVTQRAVASSLPHPPDTRLVYVEDAIATPETNPTSGVSAGDLAYVIYTSGSTGRPKGCQVTHGNVTRLFKATHPWFGFGADDVWTLFHSYAFDFTVWELWGALLYGGRLVVVPYWVSRSPDVFLDLLRRERVTVLNQTPSAFRQLIHADALAGDSAELALRCVILGGEALDLQSLRPWYARHGDQRPTLVNMYGITETTVHVTYRLLSLADVEGGAGSVIGVPIPDLYVRLLDRHGQLVPVGVPGEIYVGGAGVARGYLNRPEVTAERFVCDPFSGDPEARLYRSGDLARRLANGDLEYLGRIDDQVKIRGFRIELGEIETVLCQHPGVREAVVLAREDAPGDKRLVAYGVARPGNSVGVADLRAFSKERLPDYMVPSAFVMLEGLPVTPNGKVDRKALPASDGTGLELEKGFVAPSTPTETVIAAAFGQVLGVERVSVHDSFFDLGGHSLLATQVVSRLRDTFRTDVPLRLLFEAPTAAGLAAALQADPERGARFAEIAEMLLQVARLSADEARTMLAETNEASREA